MDGKLFFVPNCCSYNKEYVWQINVSKEFLRSLGAVIHLEKKKVVLWSYRRPKSLTSSLLYSPRSPRLQAFPVVCSQLQHHVAGGWQWASVRRGPWGRIRSQCLWHLSQLCSHCEFVCLFVFHLAACCVPQLPHPYLCHSLICIQHRRNLLRQQYFSLRQKHSSVTSFGSVCVCVVVLFLTQ